MLNVISGLLSGGAAAGGGTSYESIATTTVGAGGVASVTFSSIPSTFKHLQIRGIARGTSTAARVAIQFNGDTSQSFNRIHYLFGDGSTTGAGTTTNVMDMTTMPTSTETANAFGAVVTDILDYTNTNKYKTIRNLGGSDINGAGGYSIMYSGLWLKTEAISSITLLVGSVGSGNLAQYSSFALYGIKG